MITTDILVDAALRARRHAYAPYSRFRVGAAIRVGDALFTGCNVENASYGLIICAERAAACAAVVAGYRSFDEVVVAADHGLCCGACRQFLAEFCGDDARVHFVDPSSGEVREVWAIGELLPEAFRL